MISRQLITIIYVYTLVYANSELWRWSGRSFSERFSGFFNEILTFFFHDLGVAYVDLSPQTISEALPSAKRANYLWR